MSDVHARNSALCFIILFFLVDLILKGIFFCTSNCMCDIHKKKRKKKVIVCVMYWT